MPKMFEVSPNEHVEKLAIELKKEPEIKAPVWSAFVKTGVHKERPPAGEWWHMRAAAVLRSVAKLGPIGVSKIRTKYGGKKNRGHKPEHFYKGSGSIARKIFQQLEKAGLVRQAVIGAHKGRVITKKAAALMNSVALGMGASKVAVKASKTNAAPKISVTKNNTPKEAK